MDRISQIDSQKEFSGLCKKLFLSEYHDFQTIDDSGGDAGNDGYSEKEKILFQLYCPEKPEKTTDARYKEKIIEDLDKAKKLANGGDYEIDEWIFVTPRELRENVQTFIRKEAKARGFKGVAWASPKLESLLSKHSYLRSHFPNLILPDIETKLSSIGLSLDELVANADLGKKYKKRIETDYQKRIDESKSKLDANLFESAKNDYEAIIKDLESETESIDPHLLFRAYNNLGVAELNLNNHGEAASVFKKAYQAEPDLPMAVAKNALAEMLLTKYDDALLIIEGVLNQHPDDEHAISVKANILYLQNDFETLLPFLKSKGKIALAHWYEGFQKMADGQFEMAIQSFEKVVSMEPDNIRAIMLVAQNVMTGMREFVKNNPFPPEKIPIEMREKFGRAIECLNSASTLLQKTELKEDLEMVYTNLSGCYVALGRNNEAIEAADKAISIDSNSPVAYMNRGIAQLRLDSYPEAIQSLQKFKDLGGQDFDVDRHIAFCALRNNQLDLAEETIELELESDGKIDLDIAELAIDLYSRRLYKEKLEALLRRLEEDFSDNPQVLRMRGLYLRRIGDAGAESLLKRSYDLASTGSEKMLSELDLADFYFHQERFDDASEIYLKYVNKESGNHPTRRYIECLYNNSRFGEMVKFIEELDPSVKKQAHYKIFLAHGNLYLSNLVVASKLFKEIFEEDPSNIQSLVLYGMCNYRLGKLNETKTAYDSIRNKVDDTEKLLMLAGGYELIGEMNSAIDLTYKALTNDPNNPQAHLGFIFTFLKREQIEDYKPSEEHIKAFQKSISEFNKRFPEETALKGIEVKDDDISEILDSVSKLVEATDQATNLYKESKVPLSFIPKITGRHPFEVWAAFTQMPDVGIRASFGTVEEAAQEITLIKERESVVVDIYSLFILAHTNNLDVLNGSFEKVYVHQSVLDDIIESIEDRKMSLKKGLTVLGKQGDQHVMHEISPEEVEKVVKLLEKIKNYLTDTGKVEVKGLSSDESGEQSVAGALHPTTKNTVLLAKELNALLCCDDRILRAIVKREDNVDAFSSQNLIQNAQASGQISSEDKFDFQETIVDLHYNYVSINAPLIVHRLKEVSYQMDKVEKLVRTLVGKDTNINSLSVVLAELFLLMIADIATDNHTKIKAFTEIVKMASEHHDLNKIMEGVLYNVQKHIPPQKHMQLQLLLGQVFDDV